MPIIGIKEVKRPHFPAHRDKHMGLRVYQKYKLFFTMGKVPIAVNIFQMDI